MTKLSSSWCTAFEMYHIVRSSYTVHQRPQNEMWSLLDMFTLMFVESFALFIIKTNKPTKTNNECYSKNKSMFCLILTEGRLFSLESLFQAMLNVDHVGIDLLVLWGMMVNKCICQNSTLLQRFGWYTSWIHALRLKALPQCLEEQVSKLWIQWNPKSVQM